MTKYPAAPQPASPATAEVERICERCSPEYAHRHMLRLHPHAVEQPNVAGRGKLQWAAQAQGFDEATDDESHHVARSDASSNSSPAQPPTSGTTHWQHHNHFAHYGKAVSV